MSFVLSLKSEFKPSEDRLKSHNDSLRYITLNSVLIFFAFFFFFLSAFFLSAIFVGKNSKLFFVFVLQERVLLFFVVVVVWESFFVLNQSLNLPKKIKENDFKVF